MQVIKNQAKEPAASETHKEKLVGNVKIKDLSCNDHDTVDFNIFLGFYFQSELLQ